MPELMSFKPSDAIQGGGMVPEGRYHITRARCMGWDYNGQRLDLVPCLEVVYTNADEQEFTQYYSAGDPKNWTPTEDEKSFKKIGSASHLNNSSNCYTFWAAAMRAGLSEDKIGNDCTILIGMDVDVIHEASPEREIKGQKKKAGAVPVIGKIHAFAAAEKPKDTKAKAQQTSQTAQPTAAKGGNGLDTGEAAVPKTTAALIQALKKAANRQLEKKALTSAVFRQIPSDEADRPAILNLCIQDSFLSSLIDAGVLYDADKSMVMYVGD